MQLISLSVSCNHYVWIVCFCSAGAFDLHQNMPYSLIVNCKTLMLMICEWYIVQFVLHCKCRQLLRSCKEKTVIVLFWGKKEVGRGQLFYKIFAGEWHEEWVSGNNHMTRNHVLCILDTEWTEQQVMSVIKNQNERILRSSAILEWFQVELGGIWEARN